jgi:hypothetical protein
MTGNAAINSVENCFVGGVQKTGNCSVSPAPDGSCKGIPDPLASYLATNPVNVAGCDHHFYSASGNQSITLNPGVYCGGMTFSGPVNVTLSPGLYVIKDGTLSETGGTFTGTGVTLFLTGLNAGIQMSG